MSYRARNVGRYLTRSAMLTFALAIALSPLASLLPPNTLLRVTEKMSSASTRASSLLAEAAPLTGHMPQLLSAPTPDGTFATRLYTDANGNRMTYYLYGPANFSPTGSYPLVLILHGGGEGAKPSVRAAQNRTNLIDQPYVKAFTSGAVQDYWPSFVVAPQPGQQWVDVPATISEYTLAPQPSEWLALAIGIVQLLQQTYAQINPNRIYVVGISMGASALGKPRSAGRASLPRRCQSRAPGTLKRRRHWSMCPCGRCTERWMMSCRFRGRASW